MLVPNPRSPLMTSGLVRRAVSAAIDRQRILTEVMGDGGAPAGEVLSGPFPRGYAYDETMVPPRHDPRLAIALLRSGAAELAGDGEWRQITLVYVRSDMARRAAVAIQEQLQMDGLGFPVKLREATAAANLGTDSSWDLWLIEWPAMDPRGTRQRFWQVRAVWCGRIPNCRSPGSSSPKRTATTKPVRSWRHPPACERAMGGDSLVAIPRARFGAPSVAGCGRAAWDVVSAGRRMAGHQRTMKWRILTTWLIMEFAVSGWSEPGSGGMRGPGSGAGVTWAAEPTLWELQPYSLHAILCADASPAWSATKLSELARNIEQRCTVEYGRVWQMTGEVAGPEVRSAVLAAADHGTPQDVEKFLVRDGSVDKWMVVVFAHRQACRLSRLGNTMSRVDVGIVHRHDRWAPGRDWTPSCSNRWATPVRRWQS